MKMEEPFTLQWFILKQNKKILLQSCVSISSLAKSNIKNS